MATDMTTDVQQWWAGLLAYLGDQASTLREADWNYESAVWPHGQVGLNETWPILALRMLDEGYEWPQVVLELGLDKQPGAGNQIRLVDLDEEDRQLLMAEALEQVKREYWLGMTTGTTAAPTEAEAAKPTYPAASTRQFAITPSCVG